MICVLLTFQCMQRSMRHAPHSVEIHNQVSAYGHSQRVCVCTRLCCVCVCAYLHVCVCVAERERERRGDFLVQSSVMESTAAFH